MAHAQTVSSRRRFGDRRLRLTLKAVFAPLLAAAAVASASGEPAANVSAGPPPDTGVANVVTRCAQAIDATGSSRRPRKSELYELVNNPTVANLSLVAHANPDDLEESAAKPNSLRPRLISLAFDYMHDDVCQTYAAASALQNLYPDKPLGNIINHIECAIKNAVDAHNYDYIAVYSDVLKRANGRWYPLANALKYAVNHAASNDAHRIPEIAHLATAYVAVGHDEAASYIADSVLRPGPLAVEPTSVKVCGVPLDAVSADLRNNGFPYAERVAVATALVRERALMRAFLHRIRPSMRAKDNAGFGGDPELRKALIGVPADDPTAPARQALNLTLLETFVVTPKGDDRSREKIAPAFTSDFATFLTSYAARADLADLDEVAAVGLAFNAFLENAGYNDVSPVAADAVAALASARRRSTLNALVETVHGNRTIQVALIPLAFFAIWCLLLVAFPLRLLGMERLFAKVLAAELPLISKLLNFVIMLLLHGQFVQDRWVKAYHRLGIPNPLIEDARGLVPLPLTMREYEMEKFTPLPSLASAQVRALAARGKLRVLISGEGGIGKTTLAGYIASLAQHEDASERIYRHRAVAVTLSADLEETVTSSDLISAEITSHLERAVAGKLPVYSSLVEEMLADGRILLVIDGMSEMPLEIAKALRTFLIEKKVRCVVITSRSETIVGQVHTTLLRPGRISASTLPSFIAEYAHAHGLAVDSALEITKDLCSISDGGITPLLVSLYLVMISESSKVTASPVPVNVAELMRRYVFYLNDKVAKNEQLSHDIVMDVGRAIANLCCVQSKSFRASPADIALVRSVVGEANSARLDYFIEKLSVLRRVGAGSDHLRFAIDALCEYLAGFYVSRSYRNNDLTALAALVPGDDAEQRLALLQFTDRVEACILADIADTELNDTERRSMGELRQQIISLRAQLRDMLGLPA